MERGFGRIGTERSFKLALAGVRSARDANTCIFKLHLFPPLVSPFFSFSPINRWPCYDPPVAMAMPQCRCDSSLNLVAADASFEASRGTPLRHYTFVCFHGRLV